MTTITTEAILARSVDYGESDRILTLLTRSNGRLSVLARGARRSRRRFGAALALFVRGSAVLKAPEGQGMHRLERFDSIEDYSGAIGGDFNKVTHGSYLIELARELCPEHAPEEPLFDLLWSAITCLAARDVSVLLLRAFELQSLVISGVGPAITHCVRCGVLIGGEKDKGLPCFSLSLGGILCEGCGDGMARSLPTPTLRALLSLQDVPLDQAELIECDDATRKQLRDLLGAVIQHHLGKELKSRAFLHSVRRSEQKMGALTG